MSPRRKRLLVLLLGIVVLAPPARAQKKDVGVLFRSITVGSAAYRYEVYVPPSWTPQKKWPVILFFHGVGHRGEYAAGSTEPLLAPRFDSYQQQSRAVVVFPRCRTDAWWSDPDMEAMALGALEQTVKEFNGDPQRLYLTGLSMGGYGVWALASRHPGKFAALAPVCGGIRTPATISIPPVSTAADPYAEAARRIGGTPVWVFHGSADDTIDVAESRRMVAALRKAGGTVRYTEYAGVGHNAWDGAYRELEFFPWLLAHRLPAGAQAAH